MSERARFATTAVIGIAAGGLTALAAGRPWGTAETGAGEGFGQLDARGTDVAPIVLALALVGLASWGTVLVLRGVLRRAAAAVGFLASAGALVAAALAYGRIDDVVRRVGGGGAAGPEVSVTAWYGVVLVAGLVSAAGLGVAVLRSPWWPEMGAKYDAPGSAAGEGSQRGPADTDLWKAIDQGRDPTA